jgi:hypothetical protein
MTESERDVCPACGGRGEISFHRSYRTLAGGRGVSRSRTVLTCDVCDGSGRRPVPTRAASAPLTMPTAGSWPTDAELNEAMENAPPLAEPTEEEVNEMARYFGEE